MYMLRFDIVRCVFLLFYVLMKHIILYVWIQWCNKTTQILLTPRGGQGLQIKSFLTGKRGKKEVAATVLIKTIKYYENTKYTLKKGKKKIRTIVMCLNSSRKCKIFPAQLKCTANGISVQNVNVLPNQWSHFWNLPLHIAWNLLKYIP